MTRRGRGSRKARRSGGGVSDCRRARGLLRPHPGRRRSMRGWFLRLCLGRREPVSLCLVRRGPLNVRMERMWFLRLRLARKCPLSVRMVRGWFLKLRSAIECPLSWGSSRARSLRKRSSRVQRYWAWTRCSFSRRPGAERVSSDRPGRGGSVDGDVFDKTTRIGPGCRGLSGLLRGGGESVPAPSSEPGPALVKGREAEESGAAARASKTQE